MNASQNAVIFQNGKVRFTTLNGFYYITDIAAPSRPRKQINLKDMIDIIARQDKDAPISDDWLADSVFIRRAELDLERSGLQISWNERPPGASKEIEHTYLLARSTRGHRIVHNTDTGIFKMEMPRSGEVKATTDFEEVIRFLVSTVSPWKLFHFGIKGRKLLGARIVRAAISLYKKLDDSVDPVGFSEDYSEVFVYRRSSREYFRVGVNGWIKVSRDDVIDALVTPGWYQAVSGKYRSRERDLKNAVAARLALVDNSSVVARSMNGEVIFHHQSERFEMHNRKGLAANDVLELMANDKVAWHGDCNPILDLIFAAADTPSSGWARFTSQGHQVVWSHAYMSRLLYRDSAGGLHTLSQKDVLDMTSSKGGKWVTTDSPHSHVDELANQMHADEAASRENSRLIATPATSETNDHTGRPIWQVSTNGTFVLAAETAGEASQVISDLLASDNKHEFAVKYHETGAVLIFVDDLAMRHILSLRKRRNS